MAITEVTGVMKYKDADGNTYIMLPATTKENVEGLEEVDAHLLDKNNPHEVTAEQIGAAKAEDIITPVQSDWNQNDETALDYVKNRTHYDGPIAPFIEVGERDTDTGLTTNVPYLLQDLESTSYGANVINPDVLCDTYAYQNTYYTQFNCIIDYQTYNSTSGTNKDTTSYMLNTASKFTMIDDSNFKYTRTATTYEVVFIVDTSLLSEENLALYPSKGVYFVNLGTGIYNYVKGGIVYSYTLNDRFIASGVARKTWVTTQMDAKLSINQGTENAGKHMVVDEEGNLAPVDLPDYDSSYSAIDHNHDCLYDPKGAAESALSEAKTYTNNTATTLKNDLLNGAGEAYDTLKELGDLIDENKDALQALNDVAAGKADKEHNHDTSYAALTHIHEISDVTDLQTALDAKAEAEHTHLMVDITDRPFTEQTISLGDTLTWDGDTSGLEPIAISGDGIAVNAYHISDIVIEASELSDGIVVGYPDGEYEYDSDMIFEITGSLMLGVADVFIVENDNTTVTDMGVTFPKKGIYFTVDAEDESIYTSYLTINGYNFTETVNKLDYDALPEHLQFGNTITTYGDTLTWDGSTDGRESVEIEPGAAYLYHVSDLVPTISDFANGCTLTANVGDPLVLSAEGIIDDGNGFLKDEYLDFAISPSDNYEIDGLVFPKKGIYLVNASAYGYYVTSFIIPGYTSFIMTSIDPIDSKYLPEHLQFGEFKSVETELINCTAETVNDSGDDTNPLYILTYSMGGGFNPKSGDIAKIIFDGVEYNGVVGESINIGSEAVLFGNKSIANNAMDTTYEDTGEPFVIMCVNYEENMFEVVVYTNDTAPTTHSCQVVMYPDIVYKIDEKFIPDLGTVGKNTEGTEYTIDGSTVTASAGAEVFNDYENNIASGNHSHAEGNNTIASGSTSHAEGVSTKASGNYSHAEGYSTTASGNYSHAEGYSTIVSGEYSHAEGHSTTANSNYSHAEGYKTTASGNHSHAEGHTTTASGSFSHAEGYSTTASGNYSHAEGKDTTASGYYSHTEGESTQVTSDTTTTASITSIATAGYYGHAEGYGTVVTGRCGHAEGNGTTASGNDSHAEGNGTTASGNVSHAEGGNTIASGVYSHAEGYSTTASSNYSHAEGNGTTASGNHSHAEGAGTTASGSVSHAEGYSTTASGYASHAEGSYTKASGNHSHAEGSYTKASSNYQHVQGKYNIEDTANTYVHIVGKGSSDTARSNAHTLDWSGNAWFAGDVYVGGSSQNDGVKLSSVGLSITDVTGAEIFNCYEKDNENNVYANIASGVYSHAEGAGTTASGNHSHAEGVGTTASGTASHAEGNWTTASGMVSHAEGYRTIASGVYSHAEGGNTTASGTASHAEGAGTTASGDYQHVQGKYNIEDTTDTYAHIVGNGSSTTPSNAHTLDWSGNAWFAGDVYIGGTGQDDTANVKKLITEDDITQSDWSQNNETARDYVKNRTHWIEEARASLFTSDSTSGGDLDISTDVEPQEDIAYIVTVDGVEYRCVGYTSQTGETWFGDSRLSVTYDDDGSEIPDTTHPEDVPFLINVWAEDSLDGFTLEWKWYVIFAESGSHKLTIEVVDEENSVYHKLDEKYLPESVDGIVIRSSTAGSTKMFKITVNDSGTITATEV